MTRRHRLWVAFAIAAAAVTMSAPISSAAPPKPLRSGTITGWGATWPAMFNGEARDCQWSEWALEAEDLGIDGVDTPAIGGANPECAAWLKSRCNPALAGRNPAVTASIVDIRKLADGTTPRRFEWQAFSYPGWTVGGGVVVQLRRASCTEIVTSKWRSLAWYSSGLEVTRPGTTFVLPRGAAWMTVTTNDSANLEWRLR
jgi:hypothetical protein